MSKFDVNILFITSNKVFDTSYGGGQCSNRNFNALKKVGNLELYEIFKKTSLRSIKSISSGFFPPIEKNDFLKIINIIVQKKIDVIFLDGSIFGHIAEKIKKFNSKLKIVTFFHNVEFDYVSVRCSKLIKNFVYKHLARQSEIRIIALSDYLISLSVRDRLRVYDLYGTKTNRIIPITFNDKLVENCKTENFIGDNKNICLIVGSLKNETYYGVKWFTHNVSPYINAKTVVVGKGFETKKRELSINNVEIVGKVDDLSFFYKNAQCVAFPIFTGAGMKVKTAEALMYGKTLFGTKEAFEGYEINSNTGCLCENATEFVTNINNFFANDVRGFNNFSRILYEKNYSIECSDALFSKIFLDLGYSKKGASTKSE